MPLTSRFLAHLNHRLELACPLSVVVLVVVLHFHLLLQSISTYHGTNHYLWVKGVQVYSEVIATERKYINDFGNLFRHNLDHDQANFAQSTLGQRALKLGMQVCSDELSRFFLHLTIIL